MWERRFKAVVGAAVRFVGGSTITRGRFQPSRPVGKQLRINEQIRISPVRLIDDNAVDVGVVETNEAKRRAREAGLDLVEVAPQATPPVCKIMDYGKWKYQQKKKEQKARSHAKTSELKEVRLRPKIEEHDLGIKLNQATGFLAEGDKVQFTLLFKGREMAHREIGMQLMQEVKTKLHLVSKVESEPRLLGRRMTMVLAPDKKQAPKPAAPTPTAAAAAPTPTVVVSPAAPLVNKPQG